MIEGHGEYDEKISRNIDKTKEKEMEPRGNSIPYRDVYCIWMFYFFMRLSILLSFNLHDQQFTDGRYGKGNFISD